MNAYDKFSTLYDRLMYDCDYNKWSQYLLSRLSGKGIDFACGSGNMTLAMKKGGLDVFGVDISRKMLDVAVEKARKSGIKTEFLQADMSRFSYPQKIDFATCLIDGVNYLKPSDAERFFGNVYKMLKDGGKFIFDVSSEQKLVEVIADNVFYDDEEDVTYLWTNKLAKDKSKVTSDLMFFVKDGEKYTRFDERHVMYVHKTSELEKTLRKIGFSKIGITDADFSKKPTDKTSRVVFCATK